MAQSLGQVVTRFQFSALFCKAYAKALTIHTITEGFRTTGIYPFNWHATATHYPEPGQAWPTFLRSALTAVVWVSSAPTLLICKLIRVTLMVQVFQNLQMSMSCRSLVHPGAQVCVCMCACMCVDTKVS